MKTFLTKIEKKIQLFILALMVILIVLAVANQSYAQTATLRKVRKDQKYYSFNRWRGDQPKARIDQVKYAVEVSKENNKESKSNQRFNRKIERIRQRIK